MGYDHYECAYCFASGYGNNPLNDDDDEHHVCYSCINILISMNDGRRFTTGITQEKSYGGICFLCKEDTNSGFIVCICQEHQGSFSKSNDTNQVSHTIFVLMENETIVEAFHSRQDAEDKILEVFKNAGNSNGFKIIETNLG